MKPMPTDTEFCAGLVADCVILLAYARFKTASKQNN
ncbi:hypothetical protein TRICHSKD4_0941 [Roseibium sp. TrichSKD4]|nr:hypothetical protein TRICHSKD4_0941 [Roseibium sp. TrichSKD4]